MRFANEDATAVIEPHAAPSDRNIVAETRRDWLSFRCWLVGQFEMSVDSRHAVQVFFDGFGRAA
jgi:hypothetical protein